MSDQAYQQLENFIQSDWAVRIIFAFVLILATAVLTHLLTNIIKHAMSRESS